MFGMIGTIGMLLMVFVWLGLVLLVIWGVVQFFPHERRSTEDVERDVLRRRYVAGEITGTEYQQALRTLGYTSGLDADERGQEISLERAANEARTNGREEKKP
jgi:hypothetical protein